MNLEYYLNSVTGCGKNGEEWKSTNHNLMEVEINQNFSNTNLDSRMVNYHQM